MLNTCKTCSAKFEAKGRKPHCSPKCFRNTEKADARARRARFTPERKRAMSLTATAMQNGSLVRQPCEVCGELRVRAHHDDYARPLEVRWLCRSHHKQHRRHAALREASRAAFASPEFQSALDDMKARCVAARRARLPARPVDDVTFDRAVDVAEGGPDIVGSIYA